MTISSVYTQAFYDAGRVGMQKSAHEIVPYLYSLMQPKSVIDVGCGEGHWLKEFAELGVQRLVGVEPNVESLIAGEHLKHDLELPLVLKESFDLCLCLETAEHLTPERAHGFILDLCHLSDTIIFSAAIPKQGGNHHLNEQWASYWVEKFDAQGFFATDMLRWHFWNNTSVEVWYRQNMILFTRQGNKDSLFGCVRDVVHPVLWGYYRGLNS